MTKNFSVANTTRHPIPRMPFSKMKEKVLGKAYNLSVVFIQPKKMRELNATYRKKDTATDILAFPLSKETGEIYLCMQQVKRKAPLFEMSARAYLPYLFIHGLVHLKGYEHGKKMDAVEKKICKELRIESPH